MFSKTFLLLAFIASTSASTTKKTTKPVATPSKQPISKKPVKVPSAAPTVYVKTDYSRDYPDFNTFLPISGTDGMYSLQS